MLGFDPRLRRILRLDAAVQGRWDLLAERAVTDHPTEESSKVAVSWHRVPRAVALLQEALTVGMFAKGHPVRTNKGSAWTLPDFYPRGDLVRVGAGSVETVRRASEVVEQEVEELTGESVEIRLEAASEQPPPGMSADAWLSIASDAFSQVNGGGDDEAAKD